MIKKTIRTCLSDSCSSNWSYRSNLSHSWKECKSISKSFRNLIFESWDWATVWYTCFAWSQEFESTKNWNKDI
jgi:hypothetical protein